MNGLGQDLDDYSRERGDYDEVVRMTEAKIAALEQHRGIAERVRQWVAKSMMVGAVAAAKPSGQDCPAR